MTRKVSLVLLALVLTLSVGLVACGGTGEQQEEEEEEEYMGEQEEEEEEEQVAYDLIIDSTAGGSVTAPGEGTFRYEEGTVVALDAEADEGYVFTEWTGDTGRVADVEIAETTITMNGDYVITASFEEIPVGEIGGLHYVFWSFGRNNFHSVAVNITVHGEPDNGDGLYFQMYQGQINGVPFYFGLQTDVIKPQGPAGKGLIFSRWETRDLSNVRIVAGGWSQSAGYEGDFVGIRKNYEWTTHSYELRIAYIETDEVGDWYGVWIVDLSNGEEDYLGSIRFPGTTPANAGIWDGGITWTELYFKEVQETPIPTWHVSIDSIRAMDTDGREYLPRYATSHYSEIRNTDIYYDAVTEKIHFEMGCNVSRTHAAGRLF